MKRIFFIHLLYIVLGMMLFSPLMGLVGRLLLQFSGREVLADMDILYFFLTPYGILALIFFSALLITILGFELASVIVLYTATAKDMYISPLAALYYVGQRALNLFSFSVRLVGRILLIVLPFLAVAGGIAWFMLTDHDINYYLSHKPPVFILAAIIIGVILLILFFFLLRRLIPWILALPFLLFDNASPASTFKQSEQAMSGSKIKALKIVAVWFLFAALLGLIVFGIFQGIGSLLVPLFQGSINILVIVLGGLVAMMTLANLLVTTITTGTFGGLLVCLYEQQKGTVPAQFYSSFPAVERLRKKAPGLLVLVAAVTLVSLGVGFWLVNGIQARADIMIIAHRGAAGKAPENTMAAVQQAIKDGTDWVEIDVQETSDGEIIVVHDSDFMKLAGVSSKVWESTLQQVREIDVGSWFGPEFSDQRIPTLKEVLEAARDKARVLIELKYYGHDEQLEQRVIDIVEATDMVDQVAVMSLKNAAIQKVRTLRPDWKIGLLSATAVGNLTGLDVDFLAVNTGMAKSAFVRSAHAAGKQVMVWTVNDPLSMFRISSLGIDGIITDEPAMGRDVLAERATLNSVERLLLHTAVLFNQPIPGTKYRDQSP